MDRIALRIRRMRCAKIAMVVVAGALGIALIGSVFAWVRVCVDARWLGKSACVFDLQQGSFGAVCSSPEPGPTAVHAHRATTHRVEIQPVWLWKRRPPLITWLLAIKLPLLYPFGLSLIAVWLLHRRERTTLSALGMCRQCGYDLRESAGDVCPECGAKRGIQRDTD